MKRQEMCEAVHADSISSNGGIYTVRRGFFYRHGASSHDIARQVAAKIPLAKVISHGEVDKPFRGGASVAQSSHFWVKFVIVKPEPTALVVDLVDTHSC